MSVLLAFSPVHFLPSYTANKEEQGTFLCRPYGRGSTLVTRTHKINELSILLAFNSITVFT